MKKRRRGKIRWLSVLLTGCLLLSIIPATAFAAEDTAPAKSENSAGEEIQMPEQQNATEDTSNSVIENTSEDANTENKDGQIDKSNEKSSAEVATLALEQPKPDYLPQGVTYFSDGYKHAYHTRVDVTANVSVKDSTGTVVETTQVSKSSGEFNFITEEFPSAEVLQTAVENLQTEIETPYKARGTVTSENESEGPIIDHFESASLYTFTPTSGNPVDFSSDLEAAKRYFNEHPDATGTFTVILDVHEYQIYDYTYDLIVQENSQPTNTITAATIENAQFDYQLGDALQATAWVAVDDMDKYEIAYECWQQFENNEPVAAWYSDNGSHGSLPTITEFKSGKSYVYSLVLKPKEGYSFGSETAVTVNGESVKSSLSGEYLYVPAVKTITMPTIKVIDVVEINDATVSFQDGDKPVFTGDVPDDVYYVLRAAWWELNSTTGLISTEPEFGSGIYENKITTFEAGKTYHYGVYVVAYGDVGNIRYVFGPDTKLKINGEFVNYTRYEGDESDGSDGTMWVLTDLTMTPEAGGTTPAEKYTVTYTDGVDDEEIFKDQTYTVEAGKATPAFSGTPARDGYKFAGWSPAVTDTVTGNVTYTAQWEKLTPAKTFTVTYTDGVDNEEVFKDQTYTVEAGKATPAFNGTPTRKGYTFTGWKPAVAATVTGNATYEATWKTGSAATTPSDDKSNTGETTSPKTGDTGNGKNSITLVENKSDTVTTPKTGDTSNIVLWITLLFVSSGALVGAVVIVKKKKYNR